LNYIDIHTHSFYRDAETNLVVNVFPDELEKLQHPALFSVGLHPWHIRENSLENDLGTVMSAAGITSVIAIGETGLDKVTGIPYNIQTLAFEKQLDIAQSMGKALILHCVRSYSEMISYRKKSDLSLPWIFHWFNSDEQMAAQLIRKNCFLSFGHNLFNEQSRAFRTFRNLPASHIFFETDDAGFTIQEIYQRASQIKKTGLEELKTQIVDNFARCFNTNWNGNLVKPD